MNPTTEPTPAPDATRDEQLPDSPPTVDEPSLAPYVGADDADADETWLQGGPPKGVRVRLPIAALVLVLVALGGIWGGARLQKTQGTAATTPGAGAPGGFGAAAAGGQGATRGQAPTGAPGAAGAGAGAGNAAGGAGGAGGGAGGFGGRGGTAGTVSSVEGGKIVITNANGENVTITTADGTTVTKSETGAVSDIKPGDTIVVRGTAGSDGTTAAQTITIGGAGATGLPGGGNFPGGGGNFPGGAPGNQPAVPGN